MNDPSLIDAINTHRRRQGLLPAAVGVYGSGEGSGHCSGSGDGGGT